MFELLISLTLKVVVNLSFFELKGVSSESISATGPTFAYGFMPTLCPKCLLLAYTYAIIRVTNIKLS